MKQIVLNNQNIVQVDDQDYEYLNQFRWCYMKGYAGRSYTCTNKRTTSLMHRMIMGVSRGQEIDHVDLNKLNNQKSNLRICTRSTNMANIAKRIKTTSRYKGVYWNKRARKWCAQIEYQQKNYHLGYFTSESQAALAYNKQAQILFGAFARLN